jgi:hypothetical protein
VLRIDGDAQPLVAADGPPAPRQGNLRQGPPQNNTLEGYKGDHVDANVLNFLIGLASGIGANITTATASAVFQKVLGTRPDLERKLAQPSSPAEFQAALAEVGGVLEALAGTGSISIDGVLINALRSARFDHQHGRIHIGNTVVSAPVLQTGGTGTGQTVIGGNTDLRSSGTSIQIGQGAGIVITGNAGIKQN